MTRTPLRADLRLALRAVSALLPRLIPFALIAGLIAGLIGASPLISFLVGILIGPPVARAVRGEPLRGSVVNGAITQLLVGIVGVAGLIPGMLLVVLIFALIGAFEGVAPIAIVVFGVVGLSLAALLAGSLSLYLLSRLGIATPAAIAGDLAPVEALRYSWRQLNERRWRGQLVRRLVGWSVQLPLIGVALLIAEATPSLATIAGLLASSVGDLFGRSISQAFYERVRR